jgi:large subunit ribosomal protein L23
MSEIIIRPILTEKVTALQDKRQYAFEVSGGVNKIEIGKAVSKRFKVKVTSVRTMWVRSKSKRGRFEGRTRAWKKAIVTLHEGDKIDLFTNE